MYTKADMQRAKQIQEIIDSWPEWKRKVMLTKYSEASWNPSAHDPLKQPPMDKPKKQNTDSDN